MGIYVGGAAARISAKGDVLATVDSPDEVIRLCGLFIQYSPRAKWLLERTYAWVPRVGIEELRAIRRRPGWPGRTAAAYRRGRRRVRRPVARPR